MKKAMLFLFLAFCLSTTIRANISQIILINAEAYLVDLDDNYDVAKIHKKIPYYFSNPTSHEDMLAYYINEVNKNRDIGAASDPESESGDDSYVETEVESKEETTIETREFAKDASGVENAKFTCHAQHNYLKKTHYGQSSSCAISKGFVNLADLDRGQLPAWSPAPIYPEHYIDPYEIVKSILDSKTSYQQNAIAVSGFS